MGDSRPVNNSLIAVFKGEIWGFLRVSEAIIAAHLAIIIIIDNMRV